MSYCAYLKIDTGYELTTIYSDNYTYNVSAMYRLAFSDEQGINSLNERPVFEVLGELRAAIAHMKDKRVEYVTIEQGVGTGFGDYHGALAFLERLEKACSQHPLCIVIVE